MRPNRKWCNTYARSREWLANDKCIKDLASNVSLMFIAALGNQEFGRSKQSATKKTKELNENSMQGQNKYCCPRL